MRQAIATRFLGPTNHRGARVKATCEAGSVTLPWDYGRSAEGNHERAAQELCARLGWTWAHVGGGLANGFVFVEVTR